METTDYCSYELSKALNAAGFDEPCLTFYDANKELGRALDSDNFNHLGETYQGEWFTDTISAPLLYHAQKWLREKGIDICVLRSFSVKHGYHHRIVKDKDWENEIMQPVCAGRSYEQSLSDAISAALELITENKNN